MADWLLASLALTSMLAALVSVACAVACSKAAGACISWAKAWQKAQLELTDLRSSFESASDLLRRAAARTRMRAVRDEARDDGPPRTKAEARARYLHGKSPQDVAMEALNGRIQESER